MSAPIRLSVLDQSPIAEGSTGAQALRNTIDLARLADALGYHRYWVAEHHGGPMLAGASPEVLVGPIAAATSGLRVGSGGVMLPHYSPLKVAESFTMLAGLFPGRIDLGLGRASGTDPLTTFALQPDRRQAAPDDFPQKLAELLAYLDDDLPEDHPFARLGATLPGRPERPEPWLLGSSPQSAIWAAQLGLPYAFADFINRDGAEIAAAYRAQYAPGPGRRRSAHGGRRLGDRRRQRRRGAAPGRQQPHDAHPPAPRRAHRGPAAGEGARVPRRAAALAAGRRRAAGDHRHAGRRARRPARARRGLRGR